MSGLIFYRSDGASGSYASASTNVAARTVFPGASAPVATFVAWVRCAAAGYNGVLYLTDDIYPQSSLAIYHDTLDADSIDGTVLDDGTAGGNTASAFGVLSRGVSWDLIVWVFDGTKGTLYVNSDAGVDAPFAGGAAWTTVDAMVLFADHTHASNMTGDIATPAVYSRAWSSAERLAVLAAGPEHDLTTTTGAYSTADPVVLWDRADTAGSVANRGSGGTCNLVLHGGVTTEGATFRAFVAGTHTIRVLTNLLENTALNFEGWGFDFSDPDDADTFGEVPRITGITGTRLDMTLALDAAMQPGIVYTLTPPGMDPVTITGPRRSLAREKSPDDRVLLDIDAPFIRPSGAGGDMTIGESGDYVLSGGLATVEKVIWDTVFSTKGERYWDPARGTDLRHKQLRPLDARASQRALEAQIEAIPHVRAAVVQMLWDAGHMLISIRAETDFGRLETSRGVNDGD